MPFLGVLSSPRPSATGTMSSYGVSLPANGLSTYQTHLRYHQVPTFGNGVIRKFVNNTSEMKRLAARDFEDIL
jgi:hypothetical protein